MQASAGLSYSFSVYAPTIKDALGLSQTQLATVGSAVNLGGYFAIMSGSVYDSLKEHHCLGPRCVPDVFVKLLIHAQQVRRLPVLQLSAVAIRLQHAVCMQLAVDPAVMHVRGSSAGRKYIAVWNGL